MTTSSRTTNILLIAMLAVGIAIAGMLATGALGGPLDPPAPPASTDSVKLPGTPITSLPYQITGSGVYYLTRDLSYNGTGDAISFAPFLDHVTVDLGGFTIAGFHQGTGIRALGPTTPSQYPLMIKNGYIRNFQTGVDVELAAHVRVEGVHVFGSQGDGFVLGHVAVVDHCTSANNGGHGVAVKGSFIVVKDCMIIDNTQTGVLVDGLANLIESSKVCNGTNLRFRLGSQSIARANDILYSPGVDVIFDAGTTLNRVYSGTLCDVTNNGQPDNQTFSNIIVC